MNNANVHSIDGKLRIEFSDGAGDTYDVPVTEFRALAFIESERANSLNRQIAAALRAERRFMIRVGLARAWDGKEHAWQPRRCYIQVNGMLLLEVR